MQNLQLNGEKTWYSRVINLGLAFIFLACYHIINNQANRLWETDKEFTAMTERNTDNRSRAELMDLIRDAARSGDLTTADLYKLADFASRLIWESDGTPKATA